MNYSDEEKNLINKYKNKVTDQIQKEKEINKEIKNYEKIINKLKRKKAACKGQQTKSKKLINNIVCKKFIEDCPSDIISLILKNLYNQELSKSTSIYSKCIINKLYKVSKKFRTIICEVFNFIKIIKYGYPQILLIPFQSNFGRKFESDLLEQLLYIPFTKNTRSLIHLFVRNNKLKIMESLVSKFNNLNINVPTKVDGWLPIHNALWFNNSLVEFLTNLGIKDDWNFQNGKISKFDDIYHYIGWLYIFKKNNGLVNLENFKQNVKDNKYKIELQSKIDYEYLINYEQDTVNLISKIYEYLNEDIRNITKFEIL